jgi:hypothetical protein
VDIVFVLVGALAVVLALIFVIGNVIGRSLPVGHLASRSATRSTSARLSSS